MKDFEGGGWQSYLDDNGIMYKNKPQILVAQDHWDHFTIFCFYSSSPLPELFYTNNPPPHPPPPSHIPTSNPSFVQQTRTTGGGERGEYNGAPQGHRVSSAGQWSRPLKRSKDKYLGSELCMIFPKLVPSPNFSNLCLASLQVTHYLGRKIYLFWGCREGDQTHQLARFLETLFASKRQVVIDLKEENVSPKFLEWVVLLVAFEMLC